MGAENTVITGYEQGSARFAEASEIKDSTSHIDLKKECEFGGLPLYSDGGSKLWVDGKTTNSLIVSSTGGGKSRRICTPILLSDIAAGYSIIVTDPKAELLKSSYDFLKKHGYDIKVINFRDPQNSNRWNPLHRGASMYKERPDLAAEAFCEVGHCIYQQIHSEKDPFWEISAENVFAGMAMLACEHVDPEEVTLGLVYRMFLDGEKKLGGTRYLNEYLTDCNNPLLEQALSGLSAAPNDTRASIASVVASQLSKLVMNKSIDDMLTGKSFLAEEFVDKKTALFICLKDESSTYSTIVSLIVSDIYTNLIDYAEKHGGKLGRRVDFVLDEFSNFPAISDVSNKISACRSRNIRFFLFIQSLYQLKTVYGEDVAQVILNNCDNWVLLQGRDMKILQQFSERCGDVYGKYSQEKRPLLPAAQIQHLSKKDGEVLFLYGAEYPYIAELPDRSVYSKQLNITELTDVPAIEEERTINETEFSLKTYVEGVRDAKINAVLNSNKEEMQRQEQHESIKSSEIASELKKMANNPENGISVDDLVRRIDAKIAELEEEERVEKELEQEQASLDSLPDNSESEEGETEGENSSDEDPLPFC